MPVYHAEITIREDGALELKGLPFARGDKVEVVVRTCAACSTASSRYPLRGTPIRYDQPFDSVAEED